MPFSKHRRKPGGKAVRHPGKRPAGKAPSLERSEPTPQERFDAGYKRPFYAKYWPDDPPHDSDHLLNVIADEAFTPAGGGALRPVNKAEAFRTYTSPTMTEAEARLQWENWSGEYSLEDFVAEFSRERTEAEAEAALAFLQADGMVEVVGDEIRVPARFWLEPAGPA